MISGMVDSKKPVDVVAVGSWTNFDHLFRVDKLPAPGDTVQIISSIAKIDTIFWGGCAPNNITATAKLGAVSALVSVVGEDFKTRGYYSYLESLGVNLSGLIIVEGEHSGHSFLFADPHGDAICLSHLGVSVRQNAYEPDKQILSASKVVIINYQFDKFSCEAARLASQAGGFVIASGNLAVSKIHIEDILKHTSLLICTAHELNLLLNSGISAKTLQDLFKLGVMAVIETHGIDGSIIHTTESEIHTPAVLSSKLIDPVGAGDGFAGGVAAGISFGWDLEDAAHLGAAVASFIVEEIGCQTNQPSFEQAAERLIKNGIILPARN